MKNSKLDKIIKESIDSIISEITNNEPRLVKRESINAWNMLKELPDKIKYVMETTYRNKGGNISNRDIDELLKFIDSHISNILSITIKK